MFGKDNQPQTATPTIILMCKPLQLSEVIKIRLFTADRKLLTQSGKLYGTDLICQHVFEIQIRKMSI